LSRRSRIKIEVNAEARKRILQISVDLWTAGYRKIVGTLGFPAPDKLGPAIASLSERDRVFLYAAHNKAFVELLKKEIVEPAPNGTIRWGDGVQLITGRQGIKKAIAQLKPSFAGEMQWVEFEAKYSEGFPPLDFLHETNTFDAKKTANKGSRIPRSQAKMSHGQKATLKKVKNFP
jgi:hypothetical protein